MGNIGMAFKEVVLRIIGGNMQRAITVGDVVWPVIIVGGIALLAALCLAAVYLLNPFRSGH